MQHTKAAEFAIHELRDFVRWLLAHRPRGKALVLSIAAVLGIVALFWTTCGFEGCPDVGRLTAYQPGGAPQLFDRNGVVFADLRPVDRVMVHYGDLPPYVGAAFVAVEDKRFLEHDGVDWRRVIGAFVANLSARATMQGSSTIPMQLARNIWQDRLPASERTFRRKILETRVAFMIEDHFSKQEILELYLNNIYFGGGAYGIDAAAVSYFRKRARDLSLSEAAVLAALPKGPGIYDPRRHPERALERRNVVLALMSEQGFITPEQAEQAKESALRVADEPALLRVLPGIAPQYVERVRQVLEQKFGDAAYTGRLRVFTSLDARMQQVAAKALEEQLQRIERGALGDFDGPRRGRRTVVDGGSDYLQGAVVFLAATAGDVLVYIGGRDYLDSRFDRAGAARRQTGSAFKPFVYAAALENGIEPSAQIVDAPIRVVNDGVAWEPRNFDGEFHGVMTVHDALVNSENVPTVMLTQKIGADKVAELAKRAGITAKMDATPMIALGVTETSVLELTSAYTSFANLGERVEPRFVLRVEDELGEVLWEPAPRTHEVLEKQVAAQLTTMLSDAVNTGTGRPVREAGYSGPVAGKTGTTNDAADAWFIGYTPDIVGGVWIGFDQRRTISPDATGGRAAGPVWARIMEAILGGQADGQTGGRAETETRGRAHAQKGSVARAASWLWDKKPGKHKGKHKKH